MDPLCSILLTDMNDRSRNIFRKLTSYIFLLGGPGLGIDNFGIALMHKDASII